MMHPLPANCFSPKAQMQAHSSKLSATVRPEAALAIDGFSLIKLFWLEDPQADSVGLDSPESLGKGGGGAS
jgi:hypothetical protein